MKKLALVMTVLAIMLFVVAPAGATSYSVGMSGLGSFMKSPVVYNFNFMFGLTGTWSFTIDDSLWPDPSDPDARFDYIWNTFFAGNYDATPGAQAWRGYFDGQTLPSTPQFTMNVTSPISGTFGGDITFVVQVRDGYSDGILDETEKFHDHNINATIILNPTLGTGDLENMCGHGSMSGGDFNFVYPPTDDSLTMFGQIQINPCPSPVEDSSWGTIKALYQ